VLQGCAGEKYREHRKGELKRKGRLREKLRAANNHGRTGARRKERVQEQLDAGYQVPVTGRQGGKADAKKAARSSVGLK